MKTERAKWIGVSAALALLALGGCVNRAAQKQAKETEALLQDKVLPVSVVPVSRTEFVDSIEVTGSVVAGTEASVGAKLPSKVVETLVADGDPVAAGQVLARLDDTNYRLALRQAEAQVQASQAQLRQALTNAAVGPSRSSAAVAAAEAQLRSAKAQLQKAEKGARDEERAQAANNVEAARSGMETARKELERRRRLFEQGAISRQLLDVAENQYQIALSQYENALQAQRIAQSAVRPEDLATAREAVRQAEENLRNAQAAKKLDALLGQQVEAAKSALAAAEAQVALQRQNIEDCVVRAPFAGKVAGRPVQPGTVVGSGTPIVRLVSSEGLYFEGEVPERSSSLIRDGMPVEVRFDALGGRPIQGRISAVNPSVSTVGRLLSVRVELPSGAQGIRAGMFARGTVRLRSVPGSIVIPFPAIVERGGRKVVFVVEDGKAKAVPVRILEVRGLDARVEDIPVGAQLVVKGQDTLDEGSPVRIEAASDESGAGA